MWQSIAYPPPSRQAPPLPSYFPHWQPTPPKFNWFYTGFKWCQSVSNGSPTWVRLLMTLMTHPIWPSDWFCEYGRCQLDNHYVDRDISQKSGIHVFLTEYGGYIFNPIQGGGGHNVPPLSHICVYARVYAYTRANFFWQFLIFSVEEGTALSTQ